ncbi:MAG: ribosome biogenesis GTPase Der [Thermacetogeniaceae bacterium]
MAKPVVAIVGRPNVGKSTLFNRLTGGRTAIVADVAGVTRDRLYRDVEWDRAVFSLIDTGGLFMEEVDFAAHVHEQVDKAIAEADLVLLVVDGRVGPTTEDRGIAQMLQRARKKTVLAVNMVDNYKDSHVAYDFLKLGLGDPVPVSAVHGLNIDGLLDQVVSLLPTDTAMEPEEGVRVAVAGRPNVGKSSLVNALLKEKRLIVSDIPGTTRDAIDTVLARGDHKYVLVDTSGIRKRSHVTDGIEYYSVLRSLKAIDRADISLLVLDADQGVVEQDKKIGGYIQDAGKGIIILVNKWDLVRETDARNKFERHVRTELNFLSYAPIHYVSALENKGVVKVLDLIDRVDEQQNRRVSTGNLNSWLSETVYLNPPPSIKGQDVKIYYVVQVSVKPPTFVFFVNKPELLHFSYKRYLDRRLRDAYGFEGTPLRLIFRLRQ